MKSTVLASLASEGKISTVDFWSESAEEAATGVDGFDQKRNYIGGQGSKRWRSCQKTYFSP
jgi:hypothetical protein